jgi:predicted O-methyltransferase YrrM
MTEFQFTTDWFSLRIPEITASIGSLDAPPRNILEIGSWEGRSACWFAQKFRDAHLTCVDTWEGSVEHDPEMVSGIYDRFCHNIRVAGAEDRVTVVRSTSATALYGLAPESFDLVYVDGDHHAFAALRDIVMSWGLLRPGGVLLIDDYGGDDGTTDPMDLPTLAVDIFAKLFDKQYSCLHQGYQVHFKKNVA